MQPIRQQKLQNRARELEQKQDFNLIGPCTRN
jgi:hypothetical protein